MRKFEFDMYKCKTPVINIICRPPRWIAEHIRNDKEIYLAHYISDAIPKTGEIICLHNNFRFIVKEVYHLLGNVDITKNNNNVYNELVINVVVELDLEHENLDVRGKTNSEKYDELYRIMNN